MSQLDLFSAPITSGSHRKRDRQSSVDAAKSMSGEVLTRQQRQVLHVVANNPCHGATSYEIATQLGTQQNVMGRRLTDLGEMGCAERKWGWISGEQVYETRPGSSGRGCDVWYVTQKGRDWLAGCVDVQVAGYL